MCLIDPHLLRLRWTLVFKLIFLGRRGIPKSSLVYRRDGEILSNAFDPGWQTFDALTGGQNHRDLKIKERFEREIKEVNHDAYLQLRVMRNGTNSRRLGRNRDIPYTKLVFLHGMGRSVPIICGMCSAFSTTKLEIMDDSKPTTH
jgi:hypothetical protein